MKRALASLLLLAAPALAGCAGDPALAASLANAARPSRLPRVVACWEKEFTDAPVQSGYLATVDFVIDLVTRAVKKLRDMSPLYEMHKEGIDLKSVQWAAH